MFCTAAPSAAGTRPLAGRFRPWVAVAACLIALAAGPAQAEETLRIGYFDIPPHVVEVVEGKPFGAAISYFDRYIAPNFDHPYAWNTEITAPTRLMKQLTDGEIDAMIFLGRTAEREKIFHYPDPYLVMPEMLALRRDHPIDGIEQVDDIAGLTVGFLVGGRIPEALRDERIKFDLIAGKQLMERNVEKLLLGRIDAIYAPLSTAVTNILDDRGLGDRIKLVPIGFLPPVEIYTVFSRQSVDPDLVAKYNAALAAARVEMEYGNYIDFYRQTASR